MARVVAVVMTMIKSRSGNTVGVTMMMRRRRRTRRMMK